MGDLKNLPLITVVIPIYNIMEYLPRCVHSVTGQTYKNLEILLVDDGSTDGTGALCDSLAAEDERIRVFHKENGGSSSARNYGLDRMRGEYVGFVDSDDYLEPDAYEKLMSGILDTGAAVAQMGRDEISEAGERLPDICIPPAERIYFQSEDFLRELLMHRGDCSFCTKLLRRDVMENRRFPEGKLNEDFYLMIHLLQETEGILSLPDVCYHVFYRMGSNSRRENKDDFSRVYRDKVENADLVLEIVKKRYPKLEETAFRFGIFQRLDYMLHVPVSQMNGENEFYQSVVRYLRKNWGKAMGNRILTPKNKIYHTLFSVMPKGIRVLHQKIKRL